MGCKKGKKSKLKTKSGMFKCKKCGFVTEKKGDICKPKKVKEEGD